MRLLSMTRVEVGGVVESVDAVGGVEGGVIECGGEVDAERFLFAERIITL